MANLWVVGDSFSFINQEDSCYLQAWSPQLAKKLNYTLYNNSLYGVCQDWELQQVNLAQDNILSDDQLIVVLTDPSRYWFFEDFPHLTNTHIFDFEEIINNTNRCNAVKSFIKYIQRESLDIQYINYRLSWLNNLSIIKNWKKPIILLGFSQTILNLNHYTNLIFSKGSLTQDVSNNEISLELITDKKFNYFFGLDPRFNHMCLQNHDILVEKLYNTIKYGTELDLTSGFNLNIINKETVTDELFQSQFSEINIKQRDSIRAKTPQKSFFNRIMGDV